MFNISTVMKQTYLTQTLIISSLLLFYCSVPIDQLFFDQPAILNGDLFRLVSGHFVHVDTEHLIWNTLALLILSSIIEIRSRKLLVISFVMGIFSVTLFLFSPWSKITIYCGLSGVLNTLLVIALWMIWTETKSTWIIVTFAVCLLKVLIEMATNQSVISTISWPPSPEAHCAGLIGGIIILAMLKAHRKITDIYCHQLLNNQIF